VKAGYHPVIGRPMSHYLDGRIRKALHNGLGTKHSTCRTTARPRSAPVAWPRGTIAARYRTVKGFLLINP
jgi:hypothetical protein